MTTKKLYLAALLISAAAPLAAAPKIIGGVDLNAVDWERLCPNVKPVSITRAGATCTTVHPASDLLQRYYDISGRRPEASPIDCDIAAREYHDAITPQPDGEKWGRCKAIFGHALVMRGPGAPALIKYDDMPFSQWRSTYLGAWTVGGDKK